MNLFDESFINLGRSVYKEMKNPQKLKKINLEANSDFIEENL